MACPKVVDAPGECLDDRSIIIELGKRMGEHTWNSIMEFNTYCLEGLRMSFDDLLARPGQEIEFPVKFRKYEEPSWRWNTPSGKIELYLRSLWEGKHEIIEFGSMKSKHRLKFQFFLAYPECQ